MSLKGRLLLGGAVTVMGLSVQGMALGVIPVDPSSVHAPMWVLLTAGGMFALVGVWIMAAGTVLGDGLNLVVGPAVLVGMLSMLHWVAFGPGVRQCSGGFSIPFLSGRGPVGDLECRIAFGYGAVLFDGILLSVALSALAKKRLDGTSHRIVEGLSKALLLIVLAPFLVVLGLVVGVKAAWGKLRPS